MKFIPLPITGYLGFNNKDILIPAISCHPLLLKGYNKSFFKLTENQKLSIKNYCYLMAIGEKFLTVIHEQVLHFIYGYLNYLSPNNGLNVSPKSGKKSTNNNHYKDGGNF